jgi:hypothetical protein
MIADMQILLYSDNSIGFSSKRLAEVLDARTSAISFGAGKGAFHLKTALIGSGDAERHLSAKLLEETSDADLACFATEVRYDNNHFFQSTGNRIIYSFADWTALTDLPISNGFAYFVAATILRDLGLGTHEESIGCVNDYWWDKKEVDVGMRAAYVCAHCQAALKDQVGEAIVKDARSILDLVSHASRSGLDILDTPAGVPHFDLFLSLSSADRDAVREINSALRKAGVSTWLDEEQLRLGEPWQPQLEEQIESIAAAAVFVGPDGFGPWQDAEIRAFLSQFLKRGCPVIPVLLPGLDQPPKLPLFLQEMMWLDLRADFDGELERLIATVRQHD